MAERQIVKDTNDFLRKKSKPITEFNQRLFTLLDDMRETLEIADGAGLAAPQVGVLRRAFIAVIDEKVIEFINPEIFDEKGEEIMQEGCLSIPGMKGDVARPQSLSIKWQDRKGKQHMQTYEGVDARVICHEFDHLNGVLYIDKAENIEKVEGNTP